MPLTTRTPIADTTRAPARGQLVLVVLSMSGRRIGTGLGEAMGDQELAHNIPVIIMCSVSLYGPQRPRDLLAPTHLASGPLTRWLDRLEELGLIVRTYGTVAGDRRGALVDLTERGREMAAVIGNEIETNLADVRALRDQLSALLGD